MPHPIFGPANHTLETVRFTLRLPTPSNGRKTVVEASGWSSTKRASLWHHTESYDFSDMMPGGYDPADVLHHVALVALQDHPSSQHHFEMSIRGVGWEQLELDL